MQPKKILLIEFRIQIHDTGLLNCSNIFRQIKVNIWSKYTTWTIFLLLWLESVESGLTRAGDNSIAIIYIKFYYTEVTKNNCKLAF